MGPASATDRPQPEGDLSFSHLGVCVADLERSRRFYTEGLGFHEVASHRVGAEFARLMELPGVALQSLMLARDGVTIELLAFEAPGHSGASDRRPMNRLGITHLSFRVGDLDSVAARIEAVGGTVVRSTRTTLGSDRSLLDFVYCTDPDGTRIELMQFPAAVPPSAVGSASTRTPQ